MVLVVLWLSLMALNPLPSRHSKSSLMFKVIIETLEQCVISVQSHQERHQNYLNDVVKFEVISLIVLIISILTLNK